MPGTYDSNSRTITLHTEIGREPILTTAALINHVVTDFLFQNQFPYSHFPELVDLAVVGLGLGSLRSNLELVKNSGSFWDSTKWLLIPRPFLDIQSVAYANAVASWVRNDKDPVWAKDLIPDVKGPMKKSVKYLFKTNDCFVSRDSQSPKISERSQSEWLQDVGAKSISRQIIAVQRLSLGGEDWDEQKIAIVEKLRSRDREVLLFAIEATQNLNVESDDKSVLAPLIDEMRLLIEHRDDEVRAKAMISLTRIETPIPSTISVATKMLNSHVNYVVFAGIFALSSLESVPDEVIPPANRAFVRALQTCDYEFVKLLAASFNRWLEDPKAHLDKLLSEDSPEYYEIAMEALENVKQQLVPIE